MAVERKKKASRPRKEDRAREGRMPAPPFCAGGGAAVPGSWDPEDVAAPSFFFFDDGVGLAAQEGNVRKPQQK